MNIHEIDALKKYEHFIFNPSKKVNPATPFLIHSASGKVIASMGDTIVFAGPSKSGKSSVVAAVIAAAIAKDSEEIDSLGFSVPSELPGDAVVYVNTELNTHNFYKY